MDNTQELINKYVYYNKGNYIFDGGVYRFFNGKYAQNSNFGGMIGYVLLGNISDIQTKIIQKLDQKFDISPEGDLLEITYHAIESNDFTFNSLHKRFNSEFIIHHLLFDFIF